VWRGHSCPRLPAADKKPGTTIPNWHSVRPLARFSRVRISDGLLLCLWFVFAGKSARATQALSPNLPGIV
jgi:hypothetical protein